MKIELRDSPFEPLAEVARYQNTLTGLHGQYGATAIFIGAMRDFNDGDTVHGMTLEHYPGMTERHLQRIIESAAREWPLLDALAIPSCWRRCGRRSEQRRSRPAASSWRN